MSPFPVSLVLIDSITSVRNGHANDTTHIVLFLIIILLLVASRRTPSKISLASYNGKN